MSKWRQRRPADRARRILERISLSMGGKLLNQKDGMRLAQKIASKVSPCRQGVDQIANAIWPVVEAKAWMVNGCFRYLSKHGWPNRQWAQEALIEWQSAKGMSRKAQSLSDSYVKGLIARTAGKQCSKCGAVLPNECFSKRSSSSTGLRSACKKCCSEEFSRWWGENGERLRPAKAEYMAARRASGLVHEYEEKNRDRLRRVRSDWRNENADKIREKANARNAELVDAVVRGRIARGSQIPHSMIPDDLVQLKREQIHLHRLNKQLKQEIINQQEKENGN